jgi:hypothetical protein
MAVETAYKGMLNTTVELFDDGMCDGPNLQVGHKYLMYTSGDANDAVPARGCNRSRSIEQAKEDIEFLDLYRGGRATTHILGTAHIVRDADTDEPVPALAAAIKLQGAGVYLTALVSTSGSFAFMNIPPGHYALDAVLPGYHMDAVSCSEVDVAAGQCATASLRMQTDRGVEGIVRDIAGKPVEAARVEMMSTNTKLKRYEQPVLIDFSDSSGHFRIGGVAPGEYLVGVNILSSPVKDNPWPRTFYPATADINQAFHLTIDQTASSRQIEIRVPGRLSIVTIRGRILRADGKPPTADDRAQVRIKEPGLYGQIEREPIKVDTDGTFQFDLCGGAAYSAFAFAGPPRSTISSAPVEFTASKELELVLVLDKSPQEFLKLRQQANR